MSYAYGYFGALTLMMGATDMSGTGRGAKLKVEPPFLVSVFLTWEVSIYLLASLHAQKSDFWDSLVDSS